MLGFQVSRKPLVICGLSACGTGSHYIALSVLERTEVRLPQPLRSWRMLRDLGVRVPRDPGSPQTHFVVKGDSEQLIFSPECWDYRPRKY